MLLPLQSSPEGSNVYGWNVYGQMIWTAGSGTPTCGTSGECATYDAFGRMVEKSKYTNWSELWYTQVPGSVLSMKVTTQNYGYWPSPGRGTFVDNGEFLHQDWIGNDRIVSDIGNHTVLADRSYAPFGEQYISIGSANPVYGMFAGMTGDYDSTILFDTPNREFAQYQGRWVSPDPAGIAAADPTNPQTWNRYAYVTNNPLLLTDTTGLGPCFVEGCGGDPGCGVFCVSSPPGCDFSVCNGLCEIGGCDPCFVGLCDPPEPDYTGGGWTTGNQIFTGEDCLGCWQLGPSVTQIMQAVLSGNLFGALEMMGAIPQDPNCEFGPCDDQSFPGAMNWKANSAADCAFVGLGSGLLDFTGIGSVLKVDQNGFQIEPDLGDFLTGQGLDFLKNQAGSVAGRKAARSGLLWLGLKVSGQGVAKVASDLSGVIAVYNAGHALWSAGSSYKKCVDATPSIGPSGG